MGAGTVEQLGHALLGRLRDELGFPALGYRAAPRPLHGGKFSSVFTFELAGAPQAWLGRALVLRFVGPSVDQARLEAGLHDGASVTGLRAPRVLMAGSAGAGLGEAFVVMERLPGRAFLRGVERRFAIDFPKILASWPARFAAVIDSLGRVDAASALRAVERRGVPERLARSSRHLDWVEATLNDEPAFADVVDWLSDHAPGAPDREALVHGDLWPGNVIVRGGEFGLVDWTRGAIGDPALDVGFAKVGLALMPEPFPPPPPLRQLVHQAGTSLAERISARCDESVGGRDRVRYFEALRCAVELATVVTERRAGDAPGWEHGVPALVNHLEGITNQRLRFT